MNTKRIEDFCQYRQLLTNFNSKGVLTNNYMLPEEAESHISRGLLDYVSTDHNLALILDKGHCSRVYYYLQDSNEIMDLSPKADYAIEILYRGDNFYPEQEVGYWQRCGFVPNLVRDFYIGKYSEMELQRIERDAEISIAKTAEEVKFAITLFNASFDPYTGDFLSDAEAPSLLDKGCISVAWLDGRLAGACHAYERNKVAYLAHLAVGEYARGRRLGLSLMQEMIMRLMRDERTRYSLWVQRENAPATALYKRLGYKYGNKSTISLLKLKNR